MRAATINNKTKETDIALTFAIDDKKTISIDTKVPFLDHMLTLFAFHGNFSLTISCQGDIEVDDHHTVEDIGLALGEAIKKALGDKVGINRYAAILMPMDETLARVVLDISNRPFLVYNARLERDKLGTMDTQNVQEFLKSLAFKAGLTLHAEVLYGENDHHKVEAIFKALGKALKEASTVTTNTLPSSKGVL